jgi:hypothetical protein
MRLLPDIAESAFSEFSSSLDVLLLYEDAPTALRAKRLLDQLVEHLNLIVTFHVLLRRFDLLDSPALDALDGGDALDSDIVLLSVQGSKGLPGSVRVWLNRWLALKPDQPRALVFSLDTAARDSAAANQTLFFLQAAASRVGVEVFCHFAQTERSEFDAAIESIRYRAETTTLLLDETLHQSGSLSFRFWGIND